jgi:hypothetical protein
MSDDQLPDRAELASAYLDGELEADQRAAVENDPDAMAMVDSFARIRTELNAFRPADDAVRSAAFAAALAEFDARPEDGGEAAAAAVVTPLASRRDRGYRVLMGVAAAVVVAVVGIAALRSSTGHDENSSTAAVAPQETAEPPQLKIADTAAADANSAAGAAPAGTAAAAAEATSIESAVTSIPEIDSKDELQAFANSFQGVASPAPVASTTIAATTETTAAAATPSLGDSSFESPCLTPGVTELGQVLYRGAPAVVVRENATGIVEALDATACRVLETVP